MTLQRLRSRPRIFGKHQLRPLRQLIGVHAKDHLRRVALNQHLTPSRDTLNQLLTRSRAVQNDRLRAHRTRRPRQLQSPMNGLRPPLRNIQPLGLKRIQRRIQLPSRSQRPPRSRSRRNHASLQQELEAEKSSARFADHYPPKAHNWSCDDQRTGSRIQYRCNNRQV